MTLACEKIRWTQLNNVKAVWCLPPSFAVTFFFTRF